MICFVNVFFFNQNVDLKKIVFWEITLLFLYSILLQILKYTGGRNKMNLLSKETPVQQKRKLLIQYLKKFNGESWNEHLKLFAPNSFLTGFQFNNIQMIKKRVIS